MEISFEDLSDAFEINMKFLTFLSKINENPKKIRFLMRNQVRLTRNSGMFIDYSIEFLKDLLKKEKQGVYYNESLRLLTKIYQISLFYRLENKIDLNFLLIILRFSEFSQEIIEIFGPFFKLICENENQEFIRNVFEFLKENIANKSCFLLFMILSKKFCQKNFDFDIKIFMNIFETEEKIFWFNFLNENRNEIAYIFSKLENINGFPAVFQKFGEMFNKNLDFLQVKNLEKAKNLCLLTSIVLQNSVI